MLNLNYIDSLSFMVKAKEITTGADSLVKVKNVLTVLNGKIYVDDAYNKSGLRSMDQYPIFVSNEESFVYFNKREIQDSTICAVFRFEGIMADHRRRSRLRGADGSGNDRRWRRRGGGGAPIRW